jgi:hypothetical protein
VDLRSKGVAEKYRKVTWWVCLCVFYCTRDGLTLQP